MNNKYQKLLTITLALFCIAPSILRGETTRVLELQEQLNAQSAAFDQRMSKMESLVNSNEEAKQWYEKARELPEKSTDFQHAQAKFVKARIELLHEEVKTVSELYHINDGLFQTVSSLTDALKVESETRGNQGLNQLSDLAFQKAVRQFQGTEKLMAVLTKQGVIQKKPELRNVYATFQRHLRQVLNHANGTRVDQGQYLQDLMDVIEAQGVLMKIVLDDLHQKYIGLQTLEITGTTQVVGTRLERTFNKAVGHFSPQGEDEDWEMIDNLQRKGALAWTSQGVQPDTTLAKQLNALQERGPIDYP